MIGWRAFVHRLSDTSPIASAPDVAALSAIHVSHAERAALYDRLEGDARRISTWSFEFRLMDSLVKDQRALALCQHGYPMAYVGLARDLIPVLLLRDRTLTDVERAEFENCAPSDWLMITAWDLS